MTVTECACTACKAFDAQLEVIRALPQCELLRLESGQAPHPETMEAMLRHLSAVHAAAGNRLTAALRDAISLAWRARHELQLIREEKA